MGVRRRNAGGHQCGSKEGDLGEERCGGVERGHECFSQDSGVTRKLQDSSKDGIREAPACRNKNNKCKVPTNARRIKKHVEPMDN